MSWCTNGRATSGLQSGSSFQCWNHKGGSPIPGQFHQGSESRGFFQYCRQKRTHKLDQISASGETFYQQVRISEIVPPPPGTYVTQFYPGIILSWPRDIESNPQNIPQTLIPEFKKESLNNLLVASHLQSTKWWWVEQATRMGYYQLSLSRLCRVVRGYKETLFTVRGKF